MAANPAVSRNLKEESKIAVQQIETFLAQKDHQIKNSLLNDCQWNSIPCTVPNLVRSVDAIVDDSKDHVYLREAKSDPATIYHYQVSTGQWQKPIESKSIRWSMVFYDAVLVIGGLIKTNKSQCTCTNTLIGVRHNGDGSLRPEKVFPDMPTPRCRATTLVHTTHTGATTCTYIIVIGGEGDREVFLKTVEIWEASTPNGSWCKAQDIPEALSCSSGTIVNVYLYLLGGYYKRDHPTSSVYRCKVDALIASRRLWPMLVEPPAGKASEDVDVWEKLPDLPVQEATCTSFHDNLIVVGGIANKVPVQDIRSYNEQRQRWEVIGYLPHARSLPFVIGLPNKLIVIGGKKDSTQSKDFIEIYSCQ